MAETIAYLQFYASHLFTEVRVNDISLARATPREMKTLGIPLRSYLLPGQNSMSVSVWPEAASDAASAPKWPEQADFHARVAIFEDGEWLEATGGHPLAELMFPQGTAPAPFQRDTVFMDPGGTNPGRDWAWSRAPILDIASQGVAIAAYAAFLADRFAKRDIEAFLEATATRMAEDAVSYPQVGIAEMRYGTSQRFVTDNWRPLPADPGRLVMRPAAGGRLIELLGSDGLPFLRCETNSAGDPAKDPDYSEFRAFVGVENGRFAVLR